MKANTLKSRARKVVKFLINNRLVYFNLKEGLNSILLTFDDGPHPEYTPRILDLLDEYDARAVFFLIGERAEKAPELVLDIHDRGHVIGNHTYSHLDEYRDGTYSLNQYLDEIRQCQDLIFSITGVKTNLFRPPRGEVNLKSVLAALVCRHRVVHWSLEGGEWGRRSHESGATITQFIISNLKPKDIILLHDDNDKTIQVLKKLLPSAKERQIDLSSLSLAGITAV